MRQWIWIVVCVSIAAAYMITLEAAEAALWGWMSLIGAVMNAFYVAVKGIRSRRLRSGKDEEVTAIEDHQMHVGMMTALILIGVVGMEVAIRKVGGLWGNPWFVAFHLTLVACMTTMYVLARFKYTGFASKLHRWFAYAFLVFFAATFTTGTMLFFERFNDELRLSQEEIRRLKR